MNGYKITASNKLSKELKKSWEKLWLQAENANMFNSPRWFLTILKTCKPKKYQIYTCYKNSELVAVFPMTSLKKFGITVTSSIGNYYLYNTGFLVKKLDEELFKTFFTEILHHKNTYITRIDEKSAHLLHRLFPHTFFSIMAAVPYLEIKSNPFRYVSKSVSKEIERIVRKYNGKITNKTCDLHNNLNETLRTMIDIDQQSSKKLRSKDIFSKKENRLYFKNLIKHFADFIRIDVAYLNQVPFVYVFGLEYKKTYLYLQTAFLNDYRYLSPGKLLTHYLLSSLHKKNQVERIDFGAGINSFKQLYTPDYYIEYDLYNTKNVFIMTWWKFINLIRRTKKIYLHEKYTDDHKFLFRTINEYTTKNLRTG